MNNKAYDAAAAPHAQEDKLSPASSILPSGEGAGTPDNPQVLQASRTSSPFQDDRTLARSTSVKRRTGTPGGSEQVYDPMAAPHLSCGHKSCGV